MAIASPQNPDLARRCEAIELIVLDVDGVLTDGSIVVDDLGVESKNFQVKDGGGIALWRKSGKRVAIISGRSARCVEVRAAELGVTPVIQGCSDKRAAILKLIQNFGLEAHQVCSMGDDLADLPMLNVCGLSSCPSDASAEVVESVHFVSRVPGGRGAVRDLIELVLKHQGAWPKLVQGYRGNESSA